MTSTPMTDWLKTDLSLICNCNYLDPKFFYKMADGFNGKILQVRTVIEGSSEYYLSQLMRKERQTNITKELMLDEGMAQYAKRKYLEIQSKRERMTATTKRGRGRKKGGADEEGGIGRWYWSSLMIWKEGARKSDGECSNITIIINIFSAGEKS